MSRLIVLFVISTTAVLQYCYAETDTETVVPVTAIYQSPLSLSCDVVTEGKAINWYFNNSQTAITFGDENKVSIYFRNNNTLLIKSIKPSVTARYTCKDAENETLQQHFDLRVQAYVIQSDKPRNVVEGDPVELYCKTWGIPEPIIIWSINGTILNAEGSGGKIQLKKSKATNENFPLIDNGTLRIENIAYEEAGDYMCVSTNVIDGNIFSANGTIVVNVKDKYAALWPFLGICVEVAVLCTIILIYEKRRNKRIEEEERQEEAAHLNANNDNRAPLSDDVRQRK